MSEDRVLDGTLTSRAFNYGHVTAGEEVFRVMAKHLTLDAGTPEATRAERWAQMAVGAAVRVTVDSMGTIKGVARV